jgi:hypothetical protein
MMKMRAGLLVVGLLVVSWAVFAQGVRRDGKWEVKIETDVNGAPSGQPPTTLTQCVTPKDVDDPLKVIPVDPSSGCKFQDHKVDGNKVTWSAKCVDPDRTGTVELIYSADAYTGATKLLVEGMNFTFRYTAKRLGDCK